MFSIDKKANGDSVILSLIGKLNSVTSSEFKEQAFSIAADCKELCLDFSQLQYVASAGLRVILELHKTMTAEGKSFSLTNVDDGTMEILKDTGLTRFLVIK